MIEPTEPYLHDSGAHAGVALAADLTTPIAGYKKQSQIAVGGLLGYDFGPLTVEAYATTDVVEHNYGGWATRGWFRMIIPLWTPPTLTTKG